MKTRIRIAAWILCAAIALAPAAMPIAAVENHEAAGQTSSENGAADVQQQVLHLLRLSPTLTAAVAADPTLLSDQAYIARSNPELAQLLAQHPEVARNPEFYLFSTLGPSDDGREKALERVIWPDLAPAPQHDSVLPRLMEKMTPIIIVPSLFFAIVWVIRLFVQNHRWSRAHQQQAEVQSRLIDKFGTGQDLIAYLESEAGKRFLAGSPAGMGPEIAQRMPNVVARVLTPLQTGIVMTLLGIGLLLLRHTGSDPDMATGMTVFGTLALTPGIGFILSAAATWVLAHRLGLMPEKEAASHDQQ